MSLKCFELLVKVLAYEYKIALIDFFISLNVVIVIYTLNIVKIEIIKEYSLASIKIASS